MFGRSRRRQQRDTELLVAALDKLGSQPSPELAIAHLEGTLSALLQHNESAQAARDSIVGHLWRKVIDQEHDLTATIRQLVSLCAALSERLEIQHREQQELLDVVRVLGQKLELPSNASTPLSTPLVIDITEPTLDQDEPRRGDGWHAAS
jgi:hypothetical protein